MVLPVHQGEVVADLPLQSVLLQEDLTHQTPWLRGRGEKRKMVGQGSLLRETRVPCDCDYVCASRQLSLDIVPSSGLLQ